MVFGRPHRAVTGILSKTQYGFRLGICTHQAVMAVTAVRTLVRGLCIRVPTTLYLAFSNSQVSLRTYEKRFGSFSFVRMEHSRVF